MSDEEQLKMIYRQLNNAMVTEDIRTLSRLLPNDSILVHMTGFRQTASEWLRAIEYGDISYYSWQEEAITIVDIQSSHASLIGQSLVTARIWKMRPATWRLQVKILFEKSDGQWQITEQIASSY